VVVDDPSIAPIYEANLVLVRPDTHVAWRGNACEEGAAIWAQVLDGRLGQSTKRST
jgi:FAD-dependent monooxygenase